MKYNVPLILINPRNTSTVCPKCGAKLSYNHRLAIRPNCKFTTDRDKVGALNIYLRALKGMCGVVWYPANGGGMKDETQ
ncbi:MAG: hypothetical protein DRJ34_04310 [Thermoprotei archaeon]|nr:MAG: hypothetical protein DRJ34_04310 [Thermoprotei archaeon]